MDRDQNRTQTIKSEPAAPAPVETESAATPPVDPSPPDQATIDRLLSGAHHDPHSVLGAHQHADGTVVRTLRPHADEVHVVQPGG